MEDIVALDEAAIVDGQRRHPQHRGGVFDLLDALHLLDPDVEETDGWLLGAEQRTGHGGTHEGKLDDLTGIRPDIRPDVEHDAFGVNGGPDGGNGRAVDALDGLLGIAVATAGEEATFVVTAEGLLKDYGIHTDRHLEHMVHTKYMR